MKKLLVLLFVTSVSYASVPVRDENGCTIGSRCVSAYGYTENTKTDIPFYMHLGPMTKQTFVNHPYGHPEISCPPIVHYKRDILLPITNKLVGHLEYAFSDIYITVPTQAEVKYFPTKDVWVESAEKWDFKEFRK